jgi:serine/threonine protein kinase
MSATPSKDNTQSMPPEPDPREAARGHGAARPNQIGAYRILETLGEGGMGEVYLAEQAGPIHRRVALKIIKLGMDTNQTLARFETEREALALMNHPGVAKIFDAGTTEQGRSYFVMEHVPGIPITEYSDKHRLTTEERLRLFIDVCHAIQHAHQKGIIHRDIKPSNVLVTIQDNKHLPKVIDFGVAKATQHRLAGRTSFTEHGQLIGTPGYISPEQAEMTALDIDTRTDIYSLGVLLYELLVGARPFDEAFLHRAGFAEMKRVLREVDPPKPSTRLSSLGDQSTNIAHRRHTNPEDLAQFVRGDLDWITMKCLEKNRTCRYETVNDLRLDVERFLKHEPVLAGPPGGVYRIRKFVRRNRLAVSAVALVVVVLVAGLAGTSYGLAQAIRARHAEVSLRNIAEIRVAEASKARDEAVAWVQCLADLVASLYTEFLNFDLSETPYTVRAEACLFDRLPALIDVLLAEGDFAKVETILIHSYESVQSDTDAEQRKRVTVEGLINRICLPPFL